MASYGATKSDVRQQKGWPALIIRPCLNKMFTFVKKL